MSRSTNGLDLVILLLEPSVDDPVMAFSRVVLGALLLRKRFAQTEIVTDAVLPSCLLGVAVEGECVGDPFVDLGEG